VSLQQLQGNEELATARLASKCGKPFSNGMGHTRMMRELASGRAFAIAENLRSERHEPASDGVRIARKIGKRTHRFVVQVVPERVHKTLQLFPRESVFCDGSHQSGGDRVSLRLTRLGMQDIAPPLQADLARQRLAHELADAGDFQIERIERKECPAMLEWRKQAGKKSVAISGANQRLTVYCCVLHEAKLSPIIAGMLACIAILVLVTIRIGWAADTTINDGDTLKLGATSFRLDGIDAPELDQVCLDDKGAEWACGIEARNALIGLIGNRTVSCQDNGPDPALPGSRLGLCWLHEDPMSLNERLVREGWALNFDPKQRFRTDQDDAQKNRRGVWKGCFAAPWDLRNWRKSTAKLLGPHCDDVVKARDRLFPENIEMPPGCPIKGKVAVRARAVGYRGIYHLESCRSYRSTKNPNRWFCSEEEAKAAGFRKSYRC